MYLGKVGVLYQSKGGDTSVRQQGCMIVIDMKSVSKKEVEASLEFLNISSTLGILQILEEMGQ